MIESNLEQTIALELDFNNKTGLAVLIKCYCINVANALVFQKKNICSYKRMHLKAPHGLFVLISAKGVNRIGSQIE